MELEQIAKEYAKNREFLRTVNHQIDKIGKNVYLGDCRECWYEGHKHWHGWVAAVKFRRGFTQESSEWKVAELLDEKARLRSEVGQIKRSLYHAGNKLLKVKK